MQFTSPIFLFLFLPMLIPVYWLVGSKLRNLLLLGASIFFYAWGEGRYVLLLVISIFINYLFGILAAGYRESLKGRLILLLAISANLGVLVWYKYSGFIAENINLILLAADSPPLRVENQHLPLGISFLTFQSIAYLLDVYREESDPRKGIVRFGLFMSLFPKMAAGPIIRYEEVSKELLQRETDQYLIYSGVKRFSIGLAKKLLIADTIAKSTEQIFAIPQQDLTSGIAWLGIVCYTLQLYFDFSGYSDMAIGLGRMFGFRIRENFNYPYIARSLTDFWRRWHISLSTWLRDYLFIPLTYILMTGKIRRKIAEGKYRTNYRSAWSVFIVFTLCGLWHGAGYNFIVWGMFHGAVMGVESLWLGKIIRRWKLPFQHAYLLFVVMMAWVLFRSPTMGYAFHYYKTLAGFAQNAGLQYHVSLYISNELLLALIAGVIGATPVSRAVTGFFERSPRRKFSSLAEGTYIVLMLVLSFFSLAGSTFSPFIYQQF